MGTLSYTLETKVEKRCSITMIREQALFAV